MGIQRNELLFIANCVKEQIKLLDGYIVHEMG